MSRKNVRRFTAAAIGATATLALVGLGNGLAYAGSGARTGDPKAAHSDGGGSHCVTTARLTSAQKVASSSATNPTDYLFDLDGSSVTQVVPAPGWTPLTASQSELRRNGFPQRPKSGVALARWTKAAQSFKQAAPVGMCETDVYNTVTHTASSANWAGGMTINDTTNVNTFYDSTVEWTEPTFVSGCGSSGYSIWSGMGGWNEHNGQWRLIQNGTDVGSSLNSIHPWWEMITQNTGNPEVAFTSGGISPGDKLYSDTEYASGVAYFFVEDETTGVDWSTNLASYKGQSASYYYDGSTADAISEAPSNSGGIENLRKTSGTNIPYFVINGYALSHWRSWRINQVRGDTVQSSSFDGVHAWTDTWHNCN